MLSKAERILRILKERSGVGLTRQLLALPRGGGKVQVSHRGQTVNLYAKRNTDR